MTPDFTVQLPDSRQQARYLRQVWATVYVVGIGIGLLIALFARRRLTTPFLGLTLGLVILLLIGWTIRPRATLSAVIFLTAVSDIVTVSWFPFVKNFSSRESISFVDDALTISPLDLALFTGFAVTVLREYANHGRLVRPSPLRWPVLVFGAFVVTGFVRGVVIGGGDLRVAVIEARPITYLVLVFVIASNVYTETSDLRRGFWWLMAGVFVQVLLSLQFLSQLDPVDRAELESLNEHGSALGHNLIILTVLALLAFRARAPLARIGLIVALVPTALVYVVAQRRAGVAALGIAGVLLLIALFWRRRRLFLFVAPVVAIVTIGYLGAFWNSTSSVGFPAQAVKSVIAPGSASAEDQSSDLYRTIESYNLIATVRTDPIKGIGFGRPWYRPVTLPELDNFEMAAYLSHNSVLWLWLKLGFAGFVAMFYLVGRTVMLGARRVRELPDGIDMVVTLSAVLFVVMYTVYTFVDVSWDARNMVFFGLAAAICGGPLTSPRRTVDLEEPDTDRARPVTVG